MKTASPVHIAYFADTKIIMSTYITNLINSPQVCPLLPQLMELMVTKPRDHQLSLLHTCAEDCHTGDEVCQTKTKLVMLCAWTMQLWSRQLELADLSHINSYYCSWRRGLALDGRFGHSVFEKTLYRIWQQTIPVYKRVSVNKCITFELLQEIINYKMFEDFDSVNNDRAKTMIIAIIRSELEASERFPGWLPKPPTRPKVYSYSVPKMS